MDWTRPSKFVCAITAFVAAAVGVWASVSRDRDGGAVKASSDWTGDFDLRILPLLTKIGCNSGQCHGAAGGQAGFALSLRGYDADADFDAIVRERGGRRVDLDEPTHSLILRKPSMRIAHKGGRKLPEDGAAYEAMRAWLAAGAPRSADAAVKATGIVVSPASYLGKIGGATDVKVQARLTNGELLDVTDVSLLSSNNEAVAKVKGEGQVEIVGSGETAILVRFSTFVGFVRVGAPFGPPGAVKQSSKDLDGLVDLKLAEMGIPASDGCDDTAFLRRVQLDLTGLVPTAAEVREFLADTSTTKRASAVERLSTSQEAVSRWTRWLADLCRVRQESMGEKPAANLHEFLRAGISKRQPLDDVLRAALTSTGDFEVPGGVAFNFAAPGPMEQMEFVTRTFLGYRMQCAQCHQHPFDRWSRQDYFGAAAFFARARRDQGRMILAPFGDFTDPKSGRVALTRFPGGETVDIAEGKDRRAVFCDWMFDRESLRFDKAMVNRVWRELLGAGLVEPVDDLRESNPAINPELLQWLARQFRDGGRDLLTLVKLIANSRVYGRSAEAVRGAELDSRYYSHALVRPLSAPVLLDCLVKVTGASLDSKPFPNVERAMNLPDEDGGVYSLQAFGRCPRDGSSDPASAPPATLSMALHFIHGPVGSSWLSVKGGFVERLAAKRQAADVNIEEIFLAALGRQPSASERESAKRALGSGDMRASIEDLLWALLATTEFATNH